MTEGGALSVTYTLDADDFIIAVGAGWDAFALENGSPQTTASLVVGTLLWRHISGDNLRHVLRVLFQRARGSRRPVVVNFSCDSPSTRRQMRLELESDDGASLCVRSYLLADTPQGEAQSGPSESVSFRMCSWCNRFDFDGEWREFEDVVVDRKLLGDGGVPDISHTMCPRCFQALEAGN